VKVFNIDYVANEDTVQIMSLKGYNSDKDANAAALDPAHARLQARSANDIASLGDTLQEALWAFKAKKDEGMPADDLPNAIWEKLNPSPKKKDEPLQSESMDGNNENNGAGAGKKEKNVAAKKKAAKKVATKKSNGASTGARGEKTLKVKALLERKSGCTSADVKEATGWPAVSMPAMAKACGLKLRIEKVKGKPKQYFGS
jgi:hypothetical protein